MDLGPQPQPAIEPGEPNPGGPDAVDLEPTGIVRDIGTGLPDNLGEGIPDPLEQGMGVSSERVGHTGPGQTDTSGEKDTSPVEPAPGAAAEQSPGAEEANPAGLPPKAGYPSADPRSGF